MFMYKCLTVFSSLGYRPGRPVAAPCGDSVLDSLRNYRTLRRSRCIIFHSRQLSPRVSGSPQPHHPLSLSVLFILATLATAKWGLAVVLICISWMTNDVKQILCVYWPFAYFSLGKCLFKPFVHFLIYLSFC